MSKLIVEAITEHYGERCPDFDAECFCCKVWGEYDALISPAPCDELETVVWRLRRSEQEKWYYAQLPTIWWEKQELVTRQNAEEVIAAKDAEIEMLKKIKSMIMGDDEDAPRYTTKRLKQEVDRVTQVIRGEVSDLRAVNAAKDAEIAELKKLISSTHKNAVKHTECEAVNCPICDGGLFVCADCGAVEIDTEQKICTGSMAALEAENKRLREALEFYKDSFSYHPKRTKTGIDLSEWKPTENLLDDCGETARAALGEVKP